MAGEITNISIDTVYPFFHAVDVTIAGWAGEQANIDFDVTKFLCLIDSEGFDSSFNPQTQVRALVPPANTEYPSGIMRIPGTTTYSMIDSGPDLIVKVALSSANGSNGFIYADDTNIRVTVAEGWATSNQGNSVAASNIPVTNISTEPYNLPGAMWGTEQNLIVNGAIGETLSVDLWVGSSFGRNQTPVAGVRFAISDGSTTIDVDVTSLTEKSYISGATAYVYSVVNQDISSLNLGAVTVTPTIFPHIGDSYTLSSDADQIRSANNSRLDVWHLGTTGDYRAAYAYVQTGAGGGTVSFTEGTAAGDPFPTQQAAAAAIQAFYAGIGTGRTTASGGVIRFVDGNYDAANLTVTTIDVPLTMEAAPGNTGVFYRTSNAPGFGSTIPSRLVFGDLTIQPLVSADHVGFNSGATLSSYNTLTFKRVTWDQNGTSFSYAAWLNMVGLVTEIESVGDGMSKFNTFATNNKQVNIVGSNSGGGSAVYNMLCAGRGTFNPPQGGAGASFAESKGCVCVNSFLGTGTNPNRSVNISHPITREGLWIVCTQIEQYNNNDQPPALYINADSNEDVTYNVNIIHATTVGSRINIGYQDNANNNQVNKQILVMFCISEFCNSKGDLFTNGTTVFPSATRIGNSNILYHAGFHHNFTYQGGNDGSFTNNEVYGPGYWVGEHRAIGELAGRTSAPLNPGFVNDLTASPTGGGDYAIDFMNTDVEFYDSTLFHYPGDFKGNLIPSGLVAPGSTFTLLVPQVTIFDTPAYSNYPQYIAKDRKVFRPRISQMGIPAPVYSVVSDNYNGTVDIDPETGIVTLQSGIYQKNVQITVQAANSEGSPQTVISFDSLSDVSPGTLTSNNTNYVTHGTIGTIVGNRVSFYINFANWDATVSSKYILSQAALNQPQRELGFLTFNNTFSMTVIYGGAETSIGTVSSYFGSNVITDRTFEIEIETNGNYTVFIDGVEDSSGSIAIGMARIEGIGFKFGARSDSDVPGDTSGAALWDTGDAVREYRVSVDDVPVIQSSIPTTGTAVPELTNGNTGTIQAASPGDADLTDNEADPFSFTPVTDAATSTLILSGQEEVDGFPAGTPITGNGAEYSIAGGPFITAPSTVNPEQLVEIRQTSAPTPSTQTVVTLSVGRTDASFSVTTEGAPFVGGAQTVDARYVCFLMSGIGEAAMPEMELAWLQSQGATSENRQDAWVEFLAAQGFPQDAYPDARKAWLNSLGYTGHVSDMLNRYWKDCPTASPAPPVDGEFTDQFTEEFT